MLLKQSDHHNMPLRRSKPTFVSLRGELMAEIPVAEDDWPRQDRVLLPMDSGRSRVTYNVI